MWTKLDEYGLSYVYSIWAKLGVHVYMGKSMSI